jgi:RNA polymerase sigma factor (sigma-70 family)
MKSLYAVVGGEGGSGPSDAHLLERFVRDRDEPAFELLVRRYGRVVAGACRRILGPGPDAEDAWQATFLALACKAGDIGEAQALGGWLHTVAVRVAVRLRADIGRRARLDSQARDGRPTHPDSVFQDVARSDLRAVVDEAISRLPEKYRVPIVLCYLEGRTNEAAAAELGCPTSTVVTRLSRARDRLRAFLGRRGVGVTAGVLAATLADLSTSSVVTGADAATVAESVARVATLFVTARAAAGPVPARVASLTEGALRAMDTNRSKIVAAVFATVCLAGAGSGLLALRAADRPPSPTPGPTERVEVAQPNEPVEADGDDDTPKPKPKADPQKSGRPKAEEVVTKSFRTGQSPTVVVDLFNGAIEVVADGSGAVDARLTKRSEAQTQDLANEGLKNIQLDLAQDKDTIRVTAKRTREDLRNRSEGVDAVLKVPPGAVLDLGTTNGSVKLTGGTGKVAIRTSNGSIRVAGAAGELKLNTTNGPVVVNGARGRAEVKTTNGAIDLQVDKGVVTAHTTNGEVRVRGTLADGEHSLNTSNGRIAVTLPAAAQFRLDVSTTNGGITNEFGDSPKSKPGGAHLRTAVGDKPAISLNLKTTNGGIQILKEKTDAKKQ